MASISKLDRIESIIAMAYAISLPLSLTFSWIAFICALLVSVLLLLLDGETRNKLRSNFLPRYIWLPLLLFVLAVGLSGFAFGIKEVLLSIWAIKSIMIFIWAYFLFARKPDLAFSCLKAGLAVAAVAGVVGMIQQVFNFHPFGYQYLQGTGFLGGPMAYAGQMQIFSMLSFGIVLCLDKSAKDKLLAIIIALGNLLGVAFAGERSAWLGAIAGWLSQCAIKSKKIFLLNLIVLLFVSIVAYATVPLVKVRLEALTSSEKDPSVQVRYIVWKQAFLDYVKSPIVGIGFRKFQHFDIPWAIVPGRSKDINHAHSNYLHLAATTGLCGLLTYIWLFMAFIYRSLSLYGYWREDKAINKAQQGLALGIFGSIIAIMISGIFEYNFGTSQVQLVHWFVLGMLAINSNGEP